MADTKISAFPSVTTPTRASEIPVNESGTNKKMTVDQALSLTSVKTSVRLATVTNGTLASAFENTDVLDGVTLATGDRILLKNQTTASENGIYTVNSSGAPTRTVDFNIGSNVVGAQVFVQEGHNNAFSMWEVLNKSPITIGTTLLKFQESKYSPTDINGIIRTNAIEESTGINFALYTDPGDGSSLSSTWQQVYDQKILNPNTRMILAANPASGPGCAPRTDYEYSIGKLREVGVMVLGYVPTAYNGTACPPIPPRTDACVKDKIDKWVTWYGDGTLGKGRGISGIMFDEMTNVTGCGTNGSHVTWYKSLKDYAKDTKGLSHATGNPGADTIETYVTNRTMDQIKVFENSTGLPVLTTLFSGWKQNYNKDNFAIIPYNISTLDESYVLNARNYMGSIYIQNDSGCNPWDTISTHFNRTAELLSGRVVKDGSSFGVASVKKETPQTLYTGSISLGNNAWRGAEARQLGSAGEYFIVLSIKYRTDTTPAPANVMGGVFLVNALNPTTTTPYLLGYSAQQVAPALSTVYELPLLQADGSPPIIVEGTKWLWAAVNKDDTSNLSTRTITSANRVFTETYSTTPSATRSITWTSTITETYVTLYYRRIT